MVDGAVDRAAGGHDVVPLRFPRVERAGVVVAFRAILAPNEILVAKALVPIAARSTIA